MARKYHIPVVRVDPGKQKVVWYALSEKDRHKSPDESSPLTMLTLDSGYGLAGGVPVYMSRGVWLRLAKLNSVTNVQDELADHVESTKWVSSLCPYPHGRYKPSDLKTA